MSTTGAQLISLNDSYGVTTVNGVTKTPIGISAWKLEGISKEDAIIYPYSSLTFLSLSKGDYVFSVFGTSKAKARYTIIGRGSSGYIQTGYSQKISIQEDVKLTFNFLIENGVESNGILMIMLNSGSTSLPWEPYTGGKPSPSPEYPQEIESAGQSAEIDVDVLGKNLCEEERRTQNNIYSKAVALKSGITYILSSNKGIANFYFVDAQANKDLIKVYGKKSLTYTPDKDVIVICMTYRTPQIEDGEELQLEIGSVATAYEPYKPAQTLIIPTSGGLPGIPVSSGGNYTDEKGQQWVCDEVDFKKGVYVQRIGKKTITSKDSFFKSGLSTDDVNYFGLNNFFVHIGTRGEKDVLMSNCFVAGIYQNFGALGKIFLGSASGNVIYFSVNAQKYPDAGTFKQWAVENELMFLYQLTDIIETPLAAEELSAYKTLCTYSPTTTVINHAGAGMSVGYAKMK